VSGCFVDTAALGCGAPKAPVATNVWITISETIGCFDWTLPLNWRLWGHAHFTGLCCSARPRLDLRQRIGPQGLFHHFRVVGRLGPQPVAVGQAEEPAQA